MSAVATEMKYLCIYTKVRIPQKGTVRLKKEQLKNEKNHIHKKHFSKRIGR